MSHAKRYHNLSFFKGSGKKEFYHRVTETQSCTENLVDCKELSILCIPLCLCVSVVEFFRLYRLSLWLRPVCYRPGFQLVAVVFSALYLQACLGLSNFESVHRNRLVPAEEFSKSVQDGDSQKFSIFRVADAKKNPSITMNVAEDERRAQLSDSLNTKSAHNDASALSKIPRQSNVHVHAAEDSYVYPKQGLTLKNSLEFPPRQWHRDEQSAISGQEAQSDISAADNAAMIAMRQRSSFPMVSNPSLWPDEGQGASLFRDIRALQPMDVVTIIINESSEGNKKAETDTESKFTLQAAISKFFGVETKKIAANNTALDPTSLLDASTSDKFEGTGETTRSGSLRARISAIVIEVLPNGLLRVEGTKIVSVNSEEEVMIISGLVRPRDVDATNQVDSSRVANMRIDFYGKGVVAEHQEPGWGERVFQALWPF